MSFGGFILGILMMAVSFSMVAKTNVWLQTFGDLGHLIGLQNSSWASWKIVGIIGMMIGFMTAFGLFQLFLQLTVGQFVTFGT